MTPVPAAAQRQRMNIVIGGHVDHGKSTIIGRLLADTGSLPQGKLEQVRALCERTAKPFEYAFLLDALKDERAQGITIDAARVFFKTPARDYIIIDAPGHIEFLKNLITGAARAEAALLVIDAKEGVQENSRRHGYMMSMLGVAQVAVLVNKMDLVGHDRSHFEKIEAEYRAFLRQVGVTPVAVIPVVGRDGENIATRSKAFPWYSGPTVLEMLDAFPALADERDRAFRMPVQGVYKFTNDGDDRRIIAGTVASGTARAGDEVVFYPSGKRSAIRSFEAFNREPATAIHAGEAVGFTLKEQIFVNRGEVAALASEPRPEISSRFKVSLFWLGRDPLVPRRDYGLKIGTTRATMRVEEIHRVIDASSLSASETKTAVARHEVAECTIACNRAVAFDVGEALAGTSRFVIIDRYEISGGGIIREPLGDKQDAVREQVLLREYKWEPSFIAPERRAARFAQRPTMLVITGPKETDRKTLAKQIEARLFDEGRIAYFIGMGNVLYGIDADLARGRENRHEHVRRLGEVANLMLDAGLILIVSAQALTEEEMNFIRTSVDPSRILTVWIGDRGESDLACDLMLLAGETDEESVARIHRLLVDQGAVFRPW
ncbi:MAG TPA: GTP-binding protein [Vicinamibacterales bacterium]|nr:GTP-binding protein [Vicinamibacterales bacterium]